MSENEREETQTGAAEGLAISARMTATARGLAVRNRDSELSLLQTAEGAQATITDILRRMRELAVQSNNGSSSENGAASLNSEFDALRNEIDHVAANASFNGVSLLNGETATVTLNIQNISSINPLEVIEEDWANERIAIRGQLQSRSYVPEKEAAPHLKGLRKIRI